MSQGAAILSAAITASALVLFTFGASWLNQRNTERLLDQLEKRFDARFDALVTEIRRVDQRMDSIERRLDRIERQLEAIFNPILPPE